MKNILLVLILFSFLLLGCVTTEHKLPVPKQETKMEKSFPTPSPVPLAQPPTPAPAPIINEPSIEKFPRKNTSLYLGVWMPALEYPGEHSLERREDLIALSANTVAFGVGIPYDKDGNINELDMESVYARSRELIRYYKESDLVVLFSPEPVPANIMDEPGPIPDNIRGVFLENYEKIIIELAKISEEENVEIFSPMNEPDYKLSAGLSSSWGQDILPKIRKVYKGKIMWKGSLSELVRENKQIDFSGYDVIGFTIFPFGGIEYYQEDIKRTIDIVKKWAKDDGVPEVFASEFGTYKPVRIEQVDEPKSIDYVFEAGEGNLTGFMVFDPPRGFGTQIKGSALEAVAKKWFEKLSKGNATVPSNNYKSNVETNPSVFLESDDIIFEHYWPLDTYAKHMKADESEILVYNNGNSPVQITSADMKFIINDKTYDQYSGTWEKFASKTSWEKLEYININPNYYNGEPPLILQPEQKGKIHYHYRFDEDVTSNPNQAVKIKITFKINSNSETIDLKLERKISTAESIADNYSEQPEKSEGESSGH